MKKSLITLATSIGLVLIILLSAQAGFEDLLIIPTRTLARTINFGKILNDPDINVSQKAIISKDTNKVVGLGDFTGSGETSRVYSTSLTEFGMMKKVLEPGTMLFLGVCLLGIGLLTIKFRK
jgi:hypothetical protein